MSDEPKKPPEDFLTFQEIMAGRSPAEQAEIAKLIDQGMPGIAAESLRKIAEFYDQQKKEKKKPDISNVKDPTELWNIHKAGRGGGES